MKKQVLCIIFSLLCCISAVGAMLDDSTIVVLADWQKTEKHYFRYFFDRYEVNSNDTIICQSICRDFTIEIDDSTQHLYSLIYNRVSLPTEADSTVLDEFPLQLMTNHNGALIKVLNWDSYLAWRDNDEELCSDDLFPYVSLLSFNGKRLQLNKTYSGSQLVKSSEIGLQGVDVVLKSSMTATRDFEKSGEYALITIETVSTYHAKDDDSPIPVTDYFKQVVDSDKGWPIATYSSRNEIKANTQYITSWKIMLID